MEDTEFIEKMTEIGMTEYEAKVYYVVFQLKSATIREIYDVSGVPRNKIYSILESLEKKGFTSATSGKPLRYSMTDINKAFNNLRKASEDKYNSAEAYLNSLEKIEPMEFTQHAYEIRTKWAVDNHLKTILKRTKSELYLIVSDLDYFRKEISDSTLKTLARKSDLYVVVIKKEMAKEIPVKCYMLNDSLVKKISEDNAFPDTSSLQNSMLIVISDRRSVLNIAMINGEYFGTVVYMDTFTIISLMMDSFSKYLVRV